MPDVLRATTKAETYSEVNRIDKIRVAASPRPNRVKAMKTMGKSDLFGSELIHKREGSTAIASRRCAEHIRA